jgi:hypothetical protein
MRQRQPQHQTSSSNQRLTEHKRALFSWAILLIASTAAAQTVYRCGDQYSASPSCNGAIISSVEDARNARQAQTQKTQTLQAQQEADALERSRFKAEQQGQRNVAVVPMPNRDALFSNSAVESAAPATPPHGKHKKLASPYFTAKDNTPKPAKLPKQKAEKNGASPKAAP